VRTEKAAAKSVTTRPKIVTIRLSASTFRRLRKLAAAIDSSEDSLAVQAVESYLDLNEWQSNAIRDAVRMATAAMQGLSITMRSMPGWPRGKPREKGNVSSQRSCDFDRVGHAAPYLRPNSFFSRFHGIVPLRCTSSRARRHARRSARSSVALAFGFSLARLGTINFIFCVLGGPFATYLANKWRYRGRRRCVSWPTPCGTLR
jgi:predicted transcriptional regulator